MCCKFCWIGRSAPKSLAKTHVWTHAGVAAALACLSIVAALQIAHDGETAAMTMRISALRLARGGAAMRRALLPAAIVSRRQASLWGGQSALSLSLSFFLFAYPLAVGLDGQAIRCATKLATGNFMFALDADGDETAFEFFWGGALAGGGVCVCVVSFFLQLSRCC